MGKYKNVSFFQFIASTVVCKKNKKGEDVVKIDKLNSDNVYDLFTKLYQNHMKDIGEGRKAAYTSKNKTDNVIEIISIDESTKTVFGTIGQQNGEEHVQKRNRQTLEAEKVEVNKFQNLEIFTYFILDINNGIISYIGIYGAPKINSIAHIFDIAFNEENRQNYEFKTVNIFTEDILETMKKKRNISRIELSYAVPSDEVLSDSLVSANLNAFDECRNLSYIEYNFVIKSERGKSLLSGNKLVDIIKNNIPLTGNSFIKRMKVNAEGNSKKMQEFNLTENKITATVTLRSGEKDNIIRLEDYHTALIETYYDKKQELERYIRSSI